MGEFILKDIDWHAKSIFNVVLAKTVSSRRIAELIVLILSSGEKYIICALESISAQTYFIINWIF